MTRKDHNRYFLGAALCLLALSQPLRAEAPAAVVADEGRTPRAYTEHAIMHPDEATRRQRLLEHESLPVFKKDSPEQRQPPVSGKAVPASAAAAAPLAMDLFSDLTIIPSKWDQGLCGSCWVFASSAMLEVAMSHNYGIKDFLSTQYVLSNLDLSYPYFGYSGPPLNGCGGAGPNVFAAIYNASKVVVPWNNAHAEYKDGLVYNPDYCKTTLVPPSTIDTTPNYAIGQISLSQVQNLALPATGAIPPTQAQVIQDLKDALNQGQAVGFGFATLFASSGNADGSSTQGFLDFWANQLETTLWIDPEANNTWGASGWGAHMVTIMGYDESDPDPAKHYWILQNQWGLSANRPNGRFRMPMLMNYNNPNYQFYVFTLTMTPAAPVAPTASIALSRAKPLAGQYLEMTATVTGNPPFTYQWRKDGAVIGGEGSAVYVIPYLAASDGGHEYDVIVTNASGAATALPVTFTVGGQQLLSNPGFESGDNGAWSWTSTFPASASPDPIYMTTNAHLGGAYASLGGSSSKNQGAETGSLDQVVSIPAGAGSVSLGYWLQQYTFGTDHTWDTILDTLKIQVLDAAGNTLRTLRTYTNQQTDHFLWTRDSFDLSDFAGQTIRVHANWNEAAQNGGLNAPNARWNLDDFALTVAAAPAITLTPTAVTLVNGGSQAFVPSISNGSVDTVTWSSASGGTLPSGSTPSGAAQNYTAPASGTTDTITASTVDAPVARATARVTLVPASAVAVSVSPSSLEMMVGSTTAQLFGANVSTITNGAVSWSGSGVNTSGLFSAAGLATGTYTITATSQGAPSQSGVATVRLLAPSSITVTVTPAVPATLLVGGSQQFLATVAGVSVANQAVAWTVNGGGSVTPSGLFTAPIAGTFVVTATNTFSGVTGAARITVVSPGAVAVSVTPGTVSLLVGATQQLSATVTGVPAANNALTWAVSGGGSITPGGLFTATTVGTYTVTATNAFSGVSGTASVVVNARPTNLDLNGDGAVNPLDLLTFAKVYGTTNTSALFSGGSTVGDADLLILLAGM